MNWPQKEPQNQFHVNIVLDYEKWNDSWRNVYFFKSKIVTWNKLMKFNFLYTLKVCDIQRVFVITSSLLNNNWFARGKCEVLYVIVLYPVLPRGIENISLPLGGNIIPKTIYYKAIPFNFSTPNSIRHFSSNSASHLESRIIAETKIWNPSFYREWDIV